jgi:serine/threonine protein kinase
MKIWSVLGPPSKLEWPEGHKLAAKLGYDFPKMTKTPLEDMLSGAPSEALDLIEKMFTYDPNNRLTAKQCLEHEFFEGYERVKSPSSRSNPFNINKNLTNKNNKFVSSKFMRMNSRKFEHDRQPSPGISRTSEPDKSSAGKKLGYAKLGQMPGIRSDLSSGFYVKNKPIKSPGTPSSTNSQALYKGNKFNSKKLGGGLPLYNQSSVPVQNQNSMGKSSGSPKATVNSLRFSRNSNQSMTNAKASTSMNGAPAPVPVPTGLSTNNSFSAYNNSTSLGGGGLSRPSGMGAGLGRHQI